MNGKSLTLNLFQLLLSVIIILLSLSAKNVTSFERCRRSHQTCSIKKGVIRNYTNSQENTWDRVSFLIKLQASPVILLKKRLCHRYFPVNFAKFLRTPLLQNTSAASKDVKKIYVKLLWILAFVSIYRFIIIYNFVSSFLWDFASYFL